MVHDAVVNERSDISLKFRSSVAVLVLDKIHDSVHVHCVSPLGYIDGYWQTFCGRGGGGGVVGTLQYTRVPSRRGVAVLPVASCYRLLIIDLAMTNELNSCGPRIPVLSFSH